MKIKYIPAFVDIANFANVRKKAEIRRTLGCSDLYIFWIFFRQGIKVASFIIVGYVWEISMVPLCPSPVTYEQPRKGPS